MEEPREIRVDLGNVLSGECTNCNRVLLATERSEQMICTHCGYPGRWDWTKKTHVVFVREGSQFDGAGFVGSIFDNAKKGQT